jgi:cytochrome P450
VANKAVAERFGPKAVSHPDMLGSFIRHGLSQEDASREALLNVVAGSDTTATTIRMIMLSLLGNPGAYRRLQREIDDNIASGHVSSPIKDSEARQLPYLQACVKEGLRIKAPAAGPLYKTVPKGGDMIDGKHIPGGTHIAQSPFAMYHSKKIFGPDAAMFVPERWLDTTDKERVSRMAGVVDLVFSAGKWQCLGKAAALMETNKVIVEVSRSALLQWVGELIQGDHSSCDDSTLSWSAPSNLRLSSMR